jgi:hypothetical protein
MWPKAMCRQKPLKSAAAAPELSLDNYGRYIFNRFRNINRIVLETSRQYSTDKLKGQRRPQRLGMPNGPVWRWDWHLTLIFADETAG